MGEDGAILNTSCLSAEPQEMSSGLLPLSFSLTLSLPASSNFSFLFLLLLLLLLFFSPSHRFYVCLFVDMFSLHVGLALFRRACQHFGVSPLKFSLHFGSGEGLIPHSLEISKFSNSIISLVPVFHEPGLPLLPHV